MTDKKELAVTEGNKLIAEFMGWKHLVNTKSTNWILTEVIEGVEYAKRECYIEQMKFHSSWDWLMPACHKWDNLNMYDKDGYEYEYSILCDALDAKVSMYEIGPVWQQLVENIQWYNNQTPTK